MRSKHKCRYVNKTLFNNIFYVYGVVVDMIIKAPNEINDDYKSKVQFKTARFRDLAVVESRDIYLTGDDCLDGMLFPKKNKAYEIVVSPNYDMMIPDKCVGVVKRKFRFL